ncbi:veratrol:corrinoid protein metyltransferase [Treponema primitia ZAS-2]|uniref:Veratrol:corrinoid protein metyltransferase n=1 Tax=Treponema primitia (strain ATCC BAA-887 / DSM 12427 / ZAS-2) TaxID=545694 RepID=F5YKH2_TREPZ|nr:uroporphyrinogen decarboxylase family protein [Treponema primitia]AEF86670.1 veratrol:corrinoid protein metyltransferase [Treponema primitia ZAS-2]
MNLSPKENYLRALNHQEPEYIPFGVAESVLVASNLELEYGHPGGGIDGFGVRWVSSAEGAGQSLPDSRAFLLDDVTEWKKKVTIPNPDKIDWQSMAETQLAGVNRDTTPTLVISPNGPFERLAACMGFENALIAMVEEPDAVNELLSAITDFKIKFIKNIAKYFKPDIFYYADDIATERNLFMSPATYRELIKPQHKRIAEASKECGMIPIQHTCGRAEDIIEDIIDTGADAWSSVQPRNDIAGLLKKYGNKIVIEGGYDANGAPGFETASNEKIEAEVRRCFSEYGKYKGYTFWGFLMKTGTNLNIFEDVFNAYLKVRDGK